MKQKDDLTTHASAELPGVCLVTVHSSGCCYPPSAHRERVTGWERAPAHRAHPPPTQRPKQPNREQGRQGVAAGGVLGVRVTPPVQLLEQWPPETSHHEIPMMAECRKHTSTHPSFKLLEIRRELSQGVKQVNLSIPTPVPWEHCSPYWYIINCKI